MVASSPGMTYQSVPIQAGQGSRQASVQPEYQYSGIENNFLQSLKKNFLAIENNFLQSLKSN